MDTRTAVPPPSAPPAVAPSRAAAPTPSPARPPAADALEPFGSRCTGAGSAQRVQMRLLRSTDGARIVSGQLGEGKAGVLLVHQSGNGGTACGWWPYATVLARAGYRVELIDLRCAGGSSCPVTYAGGYVDDVAVGVRALRAGGARRVALVGASYGGAVAVAAATRLQPGVKAVVNLSGTQPDEDMAGTAAPLLTRTAAARLRAATLWAVAPGDRDADLATTRALFAAVPAPEKKLLVVPGAGHGWNMVTDRRGVVPRALEAFLAEQLR